MQSAWRKDVNTFCNDWKFAKSRCISWPCSGESCLLKNSWKNLFEWWAMRKERGLCWESPVSTSRLSEPGHEVMPAKFSSGPRRRRQAAGPGPQLRCLTSSDCIILEANVASSWLRQAASAAVQSCFHPYSRVRCAHPGTNVFVAISQTTVFCWFPF